MPGSPDLIEGMLALDEARPAYEKLWRYYAGDLPEQFVSDRLRALIGKTAQNYRFRLARVPIESLANRVGINSIVSSVGDRVNKKIEEIRQANDMELQEPFITERLFVFGDAYLFVAPTEDEDAEDELRPTDSDTVDAGVELAYQSPFSCRAMYDGEDGRTVRFVIRRWKVASELGEKWRAEVWYADRLESWISNPGAKGADITEWEPYAEDDFGTPITAIPDVNWPVENPFGEIPIKHARSDLPYGRSELEDFIGAQNLVTKATATQSSGIEAHGWRERYRIADDKALLDQAGDIVPWGDAEDAQDRSQTPRPDTIVSGRVRGPGTETIHHGTKAVGEYSAPDVSAMIEPLNQWIQLGAAASGTPLAEFDPRFGANMSGVAWDRSERPIKKKEADRKRFLLRFWRETYTLALAMVGIHDAGDITVNWAPPEVVNDPDWWNTATIRREHGVPQKTILLEANYTSEQIEEWQKNQDDDAEFLDRGIDRLSRLGDALQKLGTGATLIGIPAERIADLVQVLLGEAGSPGKLILEEKEPLDLSGDGENDGESESDDPAGQSGSERDNERGRSKDPEPGLRGSGRSARGTNAGG